MNLSGHRNDSIKQIITPTLPTTTMALTNNTDLPQPYGSETDPLFTAWLASPTGLVKANVGLGNVDNTADLSKPLSTAMTNALTLKQDIANLHTTALSASDTKYPSCTSVKNYADAITSASALLYQTLANLSTNVVTDVSSLLLTTPAVLILHISVPPYFITILLLISDIVKLVVDIDVAAPDTPVSNLAQSAAVK